MRQVPRAAPESSGSEKLRPPPPWSSTTARRYSTPSGRSTTMVSGRPATASRLARRAAARSACTVSPRAIDAALGVEEGVEPRPADRALHAAIGEVEGGMRRGRGSRSRPSRRRRRRRRARARPCRARGRDRRRRCPSASVGCVPRTSLLRAMRRISTSASGAGAGERAHEHMHAVLAGEGGEAEIGDDEPLRRALAVVLVGIRGAGAVGPRHHHVDAGLQLADAPR